MQFKVFECYLYQHWKQEVEKGDGKVNHIRKLKENDFLFFTLSYIFIYLLFILFYLFFIQDQMQKQTRLSLEITQSLNQTDRWRLPRPCKVKQGQPKSSKVTVRLHHPSAFAADLCQKERVSGRCLRSRERDLTRVGSRGILSGGLADLARRRKSSVNTGFEGGRPL